MSDGPLHQAIIRLSACAFIGCLLSACTGLDAESAASDHDALILRLDQCLEQQRVTHEKLDAQQVLQQRQSEQVTEVKGMLAKLPRRDTTPPTDRKQCKARAGKEDKLIVGAKERVWLPNLGLTLPARVDTGAETASLDARNITPFERNGKRWVRFEILHPETKEHVEVERKLERTVSIIQSNSPEPERRPVVKLRVTLGHVNQTAEFTLSNRSHLDYQILVGRNILQDVMIVDVSKRNIAPAIVPDPESSDSS
ncbi:MAG: ATP-dependent zinc protease [Halioglobus sp.]